MSVEDLIYYPTEGDRAEFWVPFEEYLGNFTEEELAEREADGDPVSPDDTMLVIRPSYSRHYAHRFYERD